MFPVQSDTEVLPAGSSRRYTNRGALELISWVRGSCSCCCESRLKVSTAVGATIPYVPAMSHCDGQRSVHPAYTGNQMPGACQAVAVGPFSSCQPSTCTLQVAAAVAATATPT